ncbi:MAG: hypothetical protein A2Y10_12595 [Planctomycetes bacterium GWF2_41_51]|nr:MAG: hypothetical protein A2Y10_12595 [Planctomycetes bacterium GWF2_41_51]HBG27260.1 hypothetical protein [Phycisphaerales bacterium]
MSKNKKTYDVFLSYPNGLKTQAVAIIKKFEDAKLVVFDSSDIKLGKNIVEETWQALAVSWAIVTIVEPGNMPPSVAVEIGAASAWQKPIYFILTEAKGKYDMPVYFSKYEVFRISEIEKVIKLILRGLNPLSNDQKEALVRAYLKLRIPTDKLLMEPGYIEQLKKMLQHEANINISGERLMQELLRLRKSGKLAKIRN